MLSCIRKWIGFNTGRLVAGSLPPPPPPPRARRLHFVCRPVICGLRVEPTKSCGPTGDPEKRAKSANCTVLAGQWTRQDGAVVSDGCDTLGAPVLMHPERSEERRVG